MGKTTANSDGLHFAKGKVYRRIFRFSHKGKKGKWITVWGSHEIASVSGAKVYRRDVVLKRGSVRPPGERKESKRGKVVEFTRRSRERLAHTASNTKSEFRTMATLTYPSQYPTSGVIVKEHLRQLLTDIEARYGKQNYLWFLEFQARGAPHIHILLSHRFLETVSKRRKGKKNYVTNEDAHYWLSHRWYEIVNSQDEKHLRAGVSWEAIREVDGARHYAVKYAFKMKQKHVPENFSDIGRFWGSDYETSRTANECEEFEIDEEEARQLLEKPLPPTSPTYRVLYGLADKARTRFRH